MNRGFSLLELLLAIIILTSGVLILAWAFSAGMFASTDSEDIELALGIANSKLERIYGTVGGVADEARHNVSDDGFTGAIYSNKNFQAEVITNNNDPEEVDVNVYWSVKGGETSISLVTLVGNQ